MYSVNGVPLDNTATGWVFRPSSEPYSAMEAEIVSVRTSGMDGSKNGMSTYGAPTLKLTVNTPVSYLETLNALFRSQDLVLRKVGDSTRYATITLLTSEVSRVYTGGRFIDMSYYVQIDGAYWRGSLVTSSAFAIGTASFNIGPLFIGMSAPIQDALVRVRGGVTGLTVRDTAGSWFTFNSILAGNYVRFDATTGRAWATSTDTWEGGTEVSGRVDFGGPRDVFEITPTWDSGNPIYRYGQLTVETATRSGAPQIQVRGRGAYIE